MTPVMLMVVWMCLRCHKSPTHIMLLQMTMAQCQRERARFAQISQEARREGFPSWSPLDAQCMPLPNPQWRHKSP